MKTSQLTGAALDWVVAKCEGNQDDALTWVHTAYPSRCYDYSTNWALAGAIIEREGISICNLEANAWQVNGWTASIGELWSPDDDGWISPTALIAAMRCYVASKLGDEVEVPEELLDYAHE